MPRRQAPKEKAAAEQPRPKGERHEFVITNFKTESGVTLPKAIVVYGTYGHLNAAKDNAILLPSHYMADFHGYEWLIGPNLALDPSKLFLVATELFGNGHSSSPSNTPEPFHGPRFPVTTIRDNVEAVHRLLTEELKVPHRAGHRRILHGRAAGVPVGGELSRVRRPHRGHLGHREMLSARHCAAGKPDCRHHRRSRIPNGDYRPQPKGLQTFGMVWAGWLFSQEWWRKELWREDPSMGKTFEEVVNDFRTRFHSRRRCQRPYPPDAHMGEARCRHYPGL